MEREWLRQMRTLFALSQYRRARHDLIGQEREEREKGSLSLMRYLHHHRVSRGLRRDLPGFAEALERSTTDRIQFEIPEPRPA